MAKFVVLIKFNSFLNFNDLHVCIIIRYLVKVKVIDMQQIDGSHNKMASR